MLTANATPTAGAIENVVAAVEAAREAAEDARHEADAWPLNNVATVDRIRTGLDAAEAALASVEDLLGEAYARA